MLDDIFVQARNNYVKGFANHEEILNWLRDQWAGIFAEALKRRQTDLKLKSLEAQISELANVVGSLRTYSEEIVKTVSKDQSGAIIKKVNRELRERQLKTFLTEELISFVIKYSDAKTKKMKEADIFAKFMASASLRDFLAAVNYDQKEALDLLGMPRARDDYDKIKTRYSEADSSPT